MNGSVGTGRFDGPVSLKATVGTGLQARPEPELEIPARQLVAVRSGGFAIDNDTSATSAIAEAAKNA